MREFWIYTGLRAAVFVGTFALVAGIWLIAAGSLNWLWALVIAFVVSGVASYTLLNGPRQAFAAKVDARATRIVESSRTKEDQD